MGTLTIIKGLPGAGKTEYCTNWVGSHTDRARVSWSDVMKMFGGYGSRTKYTAAYDSTLRQMRVLLRAGVDVILDECNLFPSEYAVFVCEAQKLKADVLWVSLAKPPCEIVDEIEHHESVETLNYLWERFEEWIKK